MVLIFSVVNSKEYVLSGDYEACNILADNCAHQFLVSVFLFMPKTQEAQLTLVF